MNVVLMEPLGITEEALQELSAFLQAGGHTFTAYGTREEDTEKLIERIKDAEVLILANQPLKAEVISACTKLKMIAVAFTGIDHINMQICRQKGVVVCNAAGYSTEAVAELAFGLMIDLYRYILPCDQAVRLGQTKGSMIGKEISGKTVGIIGTGAIGLRVAQIAKAFGCKLLGYSRTAREEGRALGITYLPLSDILRQSDIITLHLPMNPDTKGLIGKEQLALMKKDAILINTARGGVVNNEALAEALKAGNIAGAGIDVFEMEPPIPKDHPLLSAPHVVLTPHVAFATKEALYQRAVIVFENIKHYLDGQPRNVV